MKLITLTTDFGGCDWFVGVMKGVILAAAPQAKLVDISHEIPPGNVRAGAFVLAQAVAYFPRGTIHLAVVDPGVGGDREAIVIEAEEATFVGPDNGLLAGAAAACRVRAVRRIENRSILLHPISRTFHGRDVFAPVAAHLAAGRPVRGVGARRADFVGLAVPRAERAGARSRGEVVYVDRFGNAITNISPAKATPAEAEVWLRGRRLCPVDSHYGAVGRGSPVGVFGSTGFLEIAVNGGDAARKFRLKEGTAIELRSKMARSK